MNNNDIELQYKNKEDVRKVILVPTYTTLKRSKCFVQNRLDSWSNMLIFGDNLQAMKVLMKSLYIKGKVRLVYINPPFGTNQDFEVKIS